MNAAVCIACGDLLHSMHVHDIKQCKCGAITIDGGDKYSLYGGAVRLVYPIDNEDIYLRYKVLTPFQRRCFIDKADSILKDWKAIARFRSLVMNTFEQDSSSITTM